MVTLVTGAGGFLGGHLLAVLAARGEPARGLDLAYPAPVPDGVEALEGSILDADALARAMQGVTHVVHAAAISGLWAPGRFTYDRVNGLGTCLVLAAARRAGAGMVHVSSYTTLIGRATPPGVVLDERVEVTPSDLLGRYPRTKRQAELFCQSAVQAMGQRALIVQPAAPVGPGDLHLTPPTRLIADLAAGRVPALLECWMNLVDVRAVAEACLAARTRGVAGERYLLSGEDVRLTDLAAWIADLTGVPAPRRLVPGWLALGAARAEAFWSRLTGRAPTAPLTGVRLALHPCRFDNAKAREALGFAPRPLDETLPEALAWLRESGAV